MNDSEDKLFLRMIQTHEQMAQCVCNMNQSLISIDKNLVAIEKTLKMLVPRPVEAKSATLTLRAN